MLQMMTMIHLCLKVEGGDVAGDYWPPLPCCLVPWVGLPMQVSQYCQVNSSQLVWQHLY